MGVGRNYVLDLPFVVEAAVTKYTAVKLGTGAQSVTPATGAGDQCIGIAMETADAQDATDGRIISVAVMGTAVWEADGPITKGVKLRTSADGQATTLAATTADQKQVGIALTGASNAGEYITVLLTPGAEATTT